MHQLKKFIYHKEGGIFLNKPIYHKEGGIFISNPIYHEERSIFISNSIYHEEGSIFISMPIYHKERIFQAVSKFQFRGWYLLHTNNPTPNRRLLVKSWK